MMKTTKETIYEVCTQKRYVVKYNDDGVININLKDYRNKLYFFDDYVKFTDRDFIWITDDSKVVQINNSVLKLLIDVEDFIGKMRGLKTEEKINTYISFLQL